MESPCECGIEPPVSISHVVSYLVIGYADIDYKYKLCKIRSRNIETLEEEIGRSQK